VLPVRRGVTGYRKTKSRGGLSHFVVVRDLTAEQILVLPFRLARAWICRCLGHNLDHKLGVVGPMLV
jgi:hypothetical protein